MQRIYHRPKSLLFLSILLVLFGYGSYEATGGQPIDNKGTEVPKLAPVGDEGDGFQSDIRIKIASAKASSEQPNEPITLSFDGKYETHYHSAYTNEGTNYWPITIEYCLEGDEQIDYMVYHPRKSGHNGHIKEAEIWVKEKSKDFVKLMDYDFEGVNTPTRITFKQPLKNVATIKFVIKSGAGNGQGFVAISEMEFFKTNAANQLPAGIFKDEIASGLRSGVTKEQVASIKNSFYRELAEKMLEGNYQYDFRVAEYKAYPHPNWQAKENKTNTYSLLDNPTGIAVKKGEELILFVGDTHGENISLRLLDLDKPGGDGYYDGYYYSISKGVNMIKMPTSGQLYVLYHTRNYKSAQPIKMHFATGNVQGYYDVAKHTPEQYSELLDKAVHSKYFDIVGEYAHLSFPVSSYRAFAPSAKGKELIDIYDRFVRDQQEFLGLLKYNRGYGNRAFFHVMYHLWMYATDYRTAYSSETLKTVLNPDVVKSEIWGPAHEMGHTHQTRPGLMWHGTTEVTTNITSMYILTSFGNESRLMTNDDIHPPMLRDVFGHMYDKAYYMAFVGKIALPELQADVFSELVPFWQLYLYFTKVLGNEDFYKDLYELVRVEDDLQTAGENQVAFTRRASQASGYDLRPFFEAWGFYKPFSGEIDDYGKKVVTVSESIINKAKENIEKLALKQLDQRVEYINDANWTIYKDRLPVKAGGKALVTNNGGRIMVPSTWENCIAFEVEDSEGNLIGAANSHMIALVTPIEAGGKVFAVAHDGQRTEVPYNHSTF